MNKFVSSFCVTALFTLAGTVNAQSIFQNYQPTPSYQNTPTFQPVNFNYPQPKTSQYQFGCANGQCFQGQGIAVGGCATGNCGVPCQGPTAPTRTNYGPVGQREILPAYSLGNSAATNTNGFGNNNYGTSQSQYPGNLQRDPNAVRPCMHPGCPGHTNAEHMDFRNRVRSQNPNGVAPFGNNSPVNLQSNFSTPTYQPNANLSLNIQQPQFNTPQFQTQIGSPYFK